MQIKLPKEVTPIYEAVAKLERAYPGRKFTPDGHLIGSIGEVIAAQALDLELLPVSTAVHDARDKGGRYVQIKITSTTGISMSAECDRLVVWRIENSAYAQIVYDGSGASAWKRAGKMQKNGQRRISFFRLRLLEGWLD